MIAETLILINELERRAGAQAAIQCGKKEDTWEWKVAQVLRKPIWQTMENAPTDREIVVYCPPYQGLNEIYCRCKYHPDAGFTVDELRSPTLWTEVQFS